MSSLNYSLVSSLNSTPPMSSLNYSLNVIPTTPSCHHNLDFAKIDFNLKLPPPYKWKMWDYKNYKNYKDYKKPYRRNIRHNTPTNQVEFINTTILNIFSNFCPIKIIMCRHKDATWMTNKIIMCRYKDVTWMTNKIIV